MLRDMRPSELGVWAAVYSLSPWNEERADVRAGIIAAAVGNYAGKALKDGQTVSALDFLAIPRPRRKNDVGKQLMTFLRGTTPRKKKKR